MNHLFFASHLEAQPFLNEKIKQISATPEVYLGETYTVVIIGTGLTQAAANTSKYLCQNKLGTKGNFINLGIAGAVNPEFAIGSVHKIATTSIYCSEYIPETSLNIWQQSYPTIQVGEQGLNLASSIHPIWGGKFIPTLKIHKAHLVDMEGYAFSQTCTNFSIQPILYKAVSDNLMKESQNLFLKNAGLAAQQLYEFYSNLY
jgi:nucleoside phosphorylase